MGPYNGSAAGEEEVVADPATLGGLPSPVGAEIPIETPEDHRRVAVRDYLGVLWPRLTRRAIDELFAGGHVRSGGRPVAARRLLGDSPSLALARGWRLPSVVPLPSEPTGVRVLHEDDRLIVVSKPAGVPVVPAPRVSDASCLGFLVSRELQRRRARPEEAPLRPRIVHRIDRETSGVVLAAKTAGAERTLSTLFETRRVLKEYLAILEGTIEPGRITMSSPVGAGRKGRMRTGGRGRVALTEFDVLERLSSHTLVVVRPRTGRRHQIRLHAAALRHPVALDSTYGEAGGTEARARSIEGLARLALHAWRYTLPDSWPSPRVFTCPIPRDFQLALERLRASSAES